MVYYIKKNIGSTICMGCIFQIKKKKEKVPCLNSFLPRILAPLQLPKKNHFCRNMIFKKMIILAVKLFQCCFDFEEDKPLNLSYMPFVLSLLWSPIKGDHKTLYLLSYLFFDHYCAVIDKISYHRSWRFFPFRIKTSIEFCFFPPNNHVIVRII